MKRLFAMVLAAFLLLTSAVGCAGNEVYQDGVYTAEFKDYDGRGYKDYLKLTVVNSQVSEIVFDSVNEEGGQKSADPNYATNMELMQGTYPEKYTADLINQYKNMQDIGEVDVVAGATYSSESFIALFKALEPGMYKGDETLVVIENITEK